MNFKLKVEYKLSHFKHGGTEGKEAHGHMEQNFFFFFQNTYKKIPTLSKVYT